MNINFPPVDENYLKEKVGSGYYSTITEAVRDAVRRMRERDQQSQLEETRALLAIGLEQAERGELTGYSPELLKRLTAQALDNSKKGKPVKDGVKPRKPGTYSGTHEGSPG